MELKICNFNTTVGKSVFQISRADFTYVHLYSNSKNLQESRNFSNNFYISLKKRNGFLFVLFCFFCCCFFFAYRDKVGRSLCYTPTVGVQTWLRFLVQVLYLSYHLSYLHHTCMNESSIPTHGLERPGC